MSELLDQIGLAIDVLVAVLIIVVESIVVLVRRERISY